MYDHCNLGNPEQPTVQINSIPASNGLDSYRVRTTNRVFYFIIFLKVFLKIIIYNLYFYIICISICMNVLYSFYTSILNGNFLYNPCYHHIGHCISVGLNAVGKHEVMWYLGSLQYVINNLLTTNLEWVRV